MSRESIYVYGGGLSLLSSAFERSQRRAACKKTFIDRDHGFESKANDKYHDWAG